MFVSPEVWPSRGKQGADPLREYRASDRQLLLTHSCRTAIDLAFEALALRVGDEVLMPAFRDGSQVSVARQRGLVPVFYRVDRDMRADVADLEKRISPKTRLIYVIHYLGWPQQPRAIREICARRGVRMLEDCSHAVYSRDGDSLLGTFGDLTVASLRKSLGLPDGGMLLINRPEIPQPKLVRGAPSRPVISRAARLLALTYLPDFVLRTALRRATSPNGTSMEPDFHESQRGAGMSRWSGRLLHRMDSEARVAAMRAAFLQFANEWPDVEWARPMCRTLEPGVCPRIFALRSTDRAQALKLIHAEDLVAYRLWARARDSEPGPEFPDAQALKEQTIVIPLRERLESSAITSILSRLRRN